MMPPVPPTSSMEWIELTMASKSGGGLSELNGREAQPFPQGPDVIGQARRHSRSPLPPPAVGPLLPQRPNRPTEVVPIQREVGHRLMRPPILTEPVRPPRLPRVLAPVRRVLPLHERRVDRLADGRCLQGPLHLRFGPHHHGLFDGDDAVLLPLLVDRRVSQLLRQPPLRQERGTPRLADG